MSRPASRLRHWVRLVGDLAVGGAAFYASFRLHPHLPLPLTDFLLPPDRLSFFFTYWPLVALAQAAALYFFGLYDRPQPREALERARRLVPALVSLVLALGAFFFLAEREFPRSVLVVFAVLDLAALGAWRALIGAGQRHNAPPAGPVGSRAAAEELVTDAPTEPFPEMEIVGWVRRVDRRRLGRLAPDGAARSPTPGAWAPAWATLDDLPDTGQPPATLDEVVIAADRVGLEDPLPGPAAGRSDRARATCWCSPAPSRA